jgi:DNA-binding transcriptional ArsR family regulator
MDQSSMIIDRGFAALADPTRRAVLGQLGAGSATISELAERFGMSLTGMKKHVRLLEEAQLVTTEKVGRVRRCTLVPDRLQGHQHVAAAARALRARRGCAAGSCGTSGTAGRRTLVEARRAANRSTERRGFAGLHHLVLRYARDRRG